MNQVKFLIAASALLLACAAIAGTGQLLERLRIDRAAMLTAERDYHARRLRGTLNQTEATDYAAYVARLYRQVAEDCLALAEAGVPPAPDLGCPAAPPPLPAPALIDQASEKTEEEQVALLDEELLNGLGAFDEMLLQEQERVRADAPMAAASAGGGETGNATGGDGDSAGDSGDGSDGSNSGGIGRETARRQKRGGAPPDIRDDSDDDVVARQLREAAEKETDPELKKKLWEEYRKYKKGTN